MASGPDNRGDITSLLDRWVAGEREVLPELAHALYPQWRRMAQAYFRRESPGHMLQATGLVHEAYMALAALHPRGFENRRDFNALVSRLMRQILVDHARRVQTAKRGAGVEHVDADLAPDVASAKAEEFLQLDEAIDKLAQLSDRKARVVELRYFGGFSLEEVAETLGVSVASVYREQRLAEAWLGRAMGPAQ